MTDRETIRAERRKLEDAYRAAYNALDEHFTLYGDVDEDAELVGIYDPAADMGPTFAETLIITPFQIPEHWLGPSQVVDGLVWTEPDDAGEWPIKIDLSTHVPKDWADGDAGFVLPDEFDDDEECDFTDGDVIS